MTRRDAVATGTVLAGLLLAWCPCASALDPALDVSQYAHTSWKFREGFSKGGITSIAQTPDGYLWLGTEFGLTRFDGVRNVPWQPPADQPLPSNTVSALLGARDGTLWIGTLKGLASWKAGRLTRYAEVPGLVSDLLEDGKGTVWVGTLSPPRGSLCAIRDGGVHCFEEDGTLARGVFELYEDRKGDLWVGLKDALWRWRPGPARAYPLADETNGIMAVGEDDDGALLIGMGGGIRRFVDGKTQPYSLPTTWRPFQTRKMLRDRHGSLWIGTFERGIVHVHEGRTDVFAQSDGLSGDHSASLFEDREGNIWVASTNGLDRFRDLSVPTFSLGQGLSDAIVGSVLADRDGNVWLGTFGGLNQWKDGQITVPRTGRARRDGKLDGESPHSLFQDRRGRIWVSTYAGVGYLENERFFPMHGFPGGNVQAIAEDRVGNLWIANANRGLFVLSPTGEAQAIPSAVLGRPDPVSALAADPVQGDLWLGFRDGGIARFADGSVRASYGAAAGPFEGRVNQLQVDPDGTLWAATESGLRRLKNGRVATLARKNGLPCDGVNWMMDDDARSSWLNMPCGLLRVARPELDAWAAAADKDQDAKHTIHFTVLDGSDGVRLSPHSFGYVPHVAKTADGRIWFCSVEGVSVFDPGRLAANTIPPPVHIENVTADRKAYDAASSGNGALRLPPLVRDLQIEYTALSLVAPEKVLFRYKLEGRDRDWQEASTRRQAFYSDLPPRRYRFRVTACNNSGVWNEAGASLDFEIAPAYYQSAWFRIACVVTFVAFLGALYQLRLRQVAERVRQRMEGGLEERERIARDLHDTLLQSVQGLILKVDAAVRQIPSEEPARKTLEETLDRADQVLAEGRDRVRNLRGTPEELTDLPAAFQRLVAESASGSGATLKSVVEGRPRDLHPIVLEECYSIGREALGNALTHSGGHHVEIEITYEPRHFRLRIRDDGQGMDPEILGGGRPGHWGLPGMRERAGRIGAQLELWSRPGAGTEVELKVPAAAAYRGFRARSMASWFRRSAGACVLLAWCPRASALDPALDVSQYAHTAWKIREGFTKGVIRAIAQTPDGYLWLGTEFGLLRFDGVRSVPWQPPGDKHLPSSDIRSLLAARDGTLCIGTLEGLASWKDGKLTLYPTLAGQLIFRLLEDREGTVWAETLARPAGRLCAIEKGGVRCYGEDGRFGIAVVGLYEDTQGNLWAGVGTGVWRWKPGPPRFYPLPSEPNGFQGLAEDDDGALLIGMLGGIKRLVDGKTEAYPLPGVERPFVTQGLVRDRDGGIWISTFELGIVHVHQGRAEVFSRSDGLTGDNVTTAFEDREGTLWVATSEGLDRFRDLAVATYAKSQGLSNALVSTVLADREGSVWLGTVSGLNKWSDGHIAIPRTGSATRNGLLNGEKPNSLLQDKRGRIWISTPDGLGYLEGERFVPIRGAPGGNAWALAEDGAGDLWIANQDRGLVRVTPRGEAQLTPWTGLGHQDPASALAADPVRGGLWLGFYRGGVSYLKDGRVDASYAAAKGLGSGWVNGLRPDRDGTLWAATAGGLSRLKNGRVATLTTRNGLPCDAVHWMIEDDAGSLWLYMACGLVRITRPELDAWAAAADKGDDARRAIQAKVFDSFDGVRIRALAGGYKPLATKSTDGKVWFTALDGVSVFDPRHLPFNPLPPPVHIEQVTADRKTYDLPSDANGRLRLPPQVRDLQIDYTALSLVAAEKVLFRYKLEGWDRDWRDAGNRRQAFYANLPPRDYRFRVIACNNSGVWNEAGTFLDFSIAPAYYQTTWFRVACAAAFLAFLAALYQIRLRQATQRVRVRMEGRLEERERIARDLHDTLLQSVQGLILKFDAVAKRISGDDPARQALEETLDRADQILAEGRDRVRNLRDITVALSDLPTAFQQVAEKAAQDSSVTFSSVVEGRPRALDPAVLEEAYSIGREAISNAFTHSKGTHVELEITFDPRQFRLRIRDDGRGVDPAVLERGRADHWGLQGMRERAGKIGAQLELWSRPGAGTEIELRVPAAVAYRGSPDGARKSWFRSDTEAKS